MNLRQAIVFAILMENGDGIVGKSPGYIEEKEETVVMCQYPERLLDSANMKKFKKWQERWKVEFEEEKI